MSILVTGGAGYIGTHACVELLNAGYEIVVVDNFYNSKPEAIKRIKDITSKDFKFYECDLLDKGELDKIFNENNIEAIIHFAGYKAVGESVDKPLMYFQNNVTGTLILCEVMEKYKCNKIVFSSSATVYGVPKEVPIKEEAQLSVTNPYGRTKLMIEQILGDLFTSNNNWSILLLRYFNPVGAHESGLIGEDPKGIPNNLVPYIAKVAIGELDKVRVFGNDYNTVDGTGVRDYIHVVDLAKGHVKALEYALNNKGIEAVNLGTGKGYSVLQIIEAYSKASGRDIPYEITERRKGDIAECYADTSKAFSMLNWKSEYDIDKMCLDSWKWQKLNPNGYGD